MAGAGIHVLCSVGEERVHGLDQRAGGIDDVVDDEAVHALHVANHVHYFGHIHVGAALVDDGEGSAHLLREESRALHAARIRRYHGEIGQVHFAEIAHEHRAGEEVIDGDVEEALDLRCVEIDEERAVGSSGGQEVGDELGADGHARAVLAVLAGVSIIGNDDGDPRSRCAFERIDHDEQLHEVLIDGIAGGLHDEDVDAAHILEQLEVDFAVRKSLELGLADFDADVVGNLLGKPPVGGAAEESEALVVAEIAAFLALRGGPIGTRLRSSAIRSSLSLAAVLAASAVGGAFLARLILFFPCHRDYVHLRKPPSWLALAATGYTQESGWATRIRTWTSASKGHCPTIRRSPSNPIRFSNETAVLDSRREFLSKPGKLSIHRSQEHLVPV